MFFPRVCCSLLFSSLPRLGKLINRRLVGRRDKRPNNRRTWTKLDINFLGRRVGGALAKINSTAKEHGHLDFYGTLIEFRVLRGEKKATRGLCRSGVYYEGNQHREDSATGWLAAEQRDRQRMPLKFLFKCNQTKLEIANINVCSPNRDRFWPDTPFATPRRLVCESSTK